MSAIDIRPLRLSDCDKIGPPLREIWLDAYHGIQTDKELLARSHKVHTPELIALEIDDPNMHSIVAVSDDRIIGHARSDLSGEVVDIADFTFCANFTDKASEKRCFGKSIRILTRNMKYGSMFTSRMNGR